MTKYKTKVCHESCFHVSYPSSANWLSSPSKPQHVRFSSKTARIWLRSVRSPCKKRLYTIVHGHSLFIGQKMSVKLLFQKHFELVTSYLPWLGLSIISSTSTIFLTFCFTACKWTGNAGDLQLLSYTLALNLKHTVWTKQKQKYTREPPQKKQSLGATDSSTGFAKFMNLLK